MDALVAQAFAARQKRSGAPVPPRDLADMDHGHNRKSVAASMRRQGLVAKATKKFKATTDSEHALPLASNLPGQNCNAAAPNQKSVYDIWCGSQVGGPSLRVSKQTKLAWGASLARVGCCKGADVFHGLHANLGSSAFCVHFRR